MTVEIKEYDIKLIFEALTNIKKYCKFVDGCKKCRYSPNGTACPFSQLIDDAYNDCPSPDSWDIDSLIALFEEQQQEATNDN